MAESNRLALGLPYSGIQIWCTFYNKASLTSMGVKIRWHSEETIEESSPELDPPTRMQAVDSDLAFWVCRHRHICPLQEEEGESAGRLYPPAA